MVLGLPLRPRLGLTDLGVPLHHPVWMLTAHSVSHGSCPISPGTSPLVQVIQFDPIIYEKCHELTVISVEDSKRFHDSVTMTRIGVVAIHTRCNSCRCYFQSNFDELWGWHKIGHSVIISGTETDRVKSQRSFDLEEFYAKNIVHGQVTGVFM